MRRCRESNPRVTRFDLDPLTLTSPSSIRDQPYLSSMINVGQALTVRIMLPLGE
jgi:hypothetical protein